jgi:DNA-binding transcriptional MerR regulator
VRIGELSRSTGASVRSLRYYEEQGLLTPERTAGDQREYDDHAVARVEWVQLLLAAGMSTADIREFLPCTTTGRTTAAQRELLQHDRARIADQIAGLTETLRRLDDVIAYSDAHRAEPAEA